MSTQIAVRLDEEALAALDLEVREGRAASRSDALRRAVAHVRREQRYRDEAGVLVELVRSGVPVYPDLEALLDLPHPPPD